MDNHNMMLKVSKDEEQEDKNCLDPMIHVIALARLAPPTKSKSQTLSTIQDQTSTQIHTIRSRILLEDCQDVKNHSRYDISCSLTSTTANTPPQPECVRTCNNCSNTHWRRRSATSSRRSSCRSASRTLIPSATSVSRERCACRSPRDLA